MSDRRKRNAALHVLLILPNIAFLAVNLARGSGLWVVSAVALIVVAVLGIWSDRSIRSVDRLVREDSRG